jgi:hypothetical protein
MRDRPAPTLSELMFEVDRFLDRRPDLNRVSERFKAMQIYCELILTTREKMSKPIVRSEYAI